PPFGSDDDVPTVSVIGISNWRLDNSKSSRALLVQRPLFTENDLVDTARRMLGHIKDFNNVDISYFLRRLADSYLRYINNQKYSNFHGLRDYYSLVKSIRNMNTKKPNIQLALARNFGGTDQMEDLCCLYFQQVLKPQHIQKFTYNPIPVQDLINANLAEKGARNLMLIGNSNSIVTLQAYKLRQQNIEPIVIIGSQFPDDRDGGEYSYATLNRIMMCVETGRRLILTDLEIIYGSLYDLFNQNFLTDENSVDEEDGDLSDKNEKRYYTRISLGPYSNPMLYVLDEAKLPFSDPPLLNRFEKQKITLEETLNERELNILNILKEWARQISTIYEANETESNNHFSEKDLFIGFTPEETLQSLIVDQCGKNPDSNDDTIIHSCKEALISIATSDGVVRAEKSILKFSDAQDVKNWQDVYFGKQQHGSIREFYRTLLDNNSPLTSNLTIINTFSNINTNIKSSLKNVIDCQVDKQSTFKSEAELQNQIKRFYESENDLYILQCDLSTVSAGCIRLAKFIIEQFRNELSDDSKSVKHACIILHFNRKHDKEKTNLFNFMCGWNQVTIEDLDTSESSLSRFLHSTIGEILNERFEQILSQELLWCLLCMKHPSSRKSVEHIRLIQLVQEIPKCTKLVECLRLRTNDWLCVNSSDQWQLDIALDQKSLILHSSFSVALEMYVNTLIRKPIAKLLYVLERHHAIMLFFSWDQDNDENDLFTFWKHIFMNKKIVNIDDMIMDPRPDLYTISGNYLNLKFPFSHYFMEQIDQYKKLYHEELDLMYEKPENLDDDENLSPEILTQFHGRFVETIRATITILTSEIVQLAGNLYLDDFVIISSTNAGYSQESDVKLLHFLLSRSCDAEVLNDPIRLHIYWWKNSDALISELELARICPSVIELDNEDHEKDNRFGTYLIDNVCRIMIEKLIKLGTPKDDKNEVSDDNVNETANDEEVADDSVNETANDNEEVENDTNSEFASENNNEPTNNDNNDENNGDMKEVDVITFLHEWRRQVVSILSLCANIEGSSESILLQFLRICNDLISSESIGLSDIVKALNLTKEIDSENILSREFVDYILELLTKITVTEKTITSHCSFLRRCLDIVPLGSPVRSHLYEILFKQEPRPLFGSVLSRALMPEEESIPLLFQNTPATLIRYPNLNATNNALKSNEVDAPIYALCCDVLQYNFFASYTFKELADGFRDAIDILCSANFEPLQLVLSVALLKEFVNYRTFSWLKDFEWSDEDNRIGFIPYRSYTHYNEAEEAFTPLLERGQQTQAMNFLNRVSNDASMNLKMSLMGVVISRLYIIRSLRELRPNEVNAIKWLRTQSNNIEFDNFYRETLLNITGNEHKLYSVSPETSQTELLIRSVIAHIIALHSCLPATNSPLAAYMQTLKACKDTYILTSCADIDANILIEIGAALGQFTRYECECGFKYIVTECGGTREEGTCPRCNSRIGGLNYQVNPGNKRIDTAAIHGNEETEVKLGYIYESIESRKDSNFRLRNLTPVSFRILHLFVHVLIAANSQEDCGDFLNSQQGQEIIQEPLDYCKRHIENDWNILTRLFDCNDETLALVLHSILSLMAENPITTIARLDTVENRRLWEHEFTQRYITPKVSNVHGTAAEFKERVKNVEHRLESEIDETMEVTEEYRLKFHPRIWRRVVETSLESFRAYCIGHQNFATEFPFLSLFLEYQGQVSLLSNLAPIVKFARILSSKLSYRLKRADSRILTFDQFLKSEAQSTENLKETFENFVAAWNSVREHITRYECHEFASPMPEMAGNLPLIYALIDLRDESLYICGAIDYLVNLQNNFLQQVLTIEPGCASLRFLEQGQLSNSNNTMNQGQYYIETMSLSEARDIHLMNYEWNPRLLTYSQRDLKLGHGQEMQYELYKIEAELAHSLIFNKVHLNKSNERFWLDIFSYHLELFSSSRTIISEIKELIPQEMVPTEKLGSFVVTTSSPTKIGTNVTLVFENPTELLSEFEVLLCFLKRTSGGDRDIKITDYLDKWVRLSALKENDQFYRIINGLKLKHVVSLYELVEEKVADVEIEFLPEKYKAKLGKPLQDEITAGVDFEQSHGIGGSNNRKLRIPHDAFAIALKRFMFRYLSSEMFSEKEKLSDYLAGETIIDCWQSFVSEDVIRDKFPKSLLIANIYEAYRYTIKQIQEMNKANSQNKTNKGASSSNSKQNDISAKPAGRGKKSTRKLKEEDGSLRDFLKEKFPSLRWTQKLEILFTAAKGLSDIHNAGLIHKDFHSGNIVLSDLTSFITDFGFCKPANYNSPEAEGNKIFV
ncbi:46_t:CDS:10, partial [Acaulospora colombiana]